MICLRCHRDVIAGLIIHFERRAGTVDYEYTGGCPKCHTQTMFAKSNLSNVPDSVNYTSHERAITCDRCRSAFPESYLRNKARFQAGGVDLKSLEAICPSCSNMIRWRHLQRDDYDSAPMSHPTALNGYELHQQMKMQQQMSRGLMHVSGMDSYSPRQSSLFNQAAILKQIAAVEQSVSDKNSGVKLKTLDHSIFTPEPSIHLKTTD